MPSVHFVALLMGVMWGAAPSSLAQDRRPTISYISQPEIVTDIGGTIEMRCNVQYAQDYPVIWMKLDPVDRNNDLPITTGTTLILTDPVELEFFDNELIERFCEPSRLRDSTLLERWNLSD